MEPPELILLAINKNLTRWNDSVEGLAEGHLSYELFGIHYRVVATLLYVIIFTLGVAGNCLVIFTIYCSPSLHTSPYSYLVKAIFIVGVLPIA